MKIQPLRTDGCFEDVVEKYSDMIYRIAYANVKVKADADDVFQEVWFGDIKEGETVTVETEMYFMILPTVGRKYVLPLCDEGSAINLDEAGQTYLGGDIKRESIYSIIYPFQMQIEKNEKGYIFPATWESLITEETKDVTVDISLTATEAEYDKMKLDSEEAFTEQFTKLLTETGLTN